MTILTIMITIILGILMLIIGLTTKRKWIIIISIFPILIALSQIAILFLMAFH